MRWDQHLSRWCRVILAVWVRRLNASQDKNFVSGEKALSASLKSGWRFEGMLQLSLIGRRWNGERNSSLYERSTHYVDSLYSCYMVYMCLLQGTPPLYSDNGMVSVLPCLVLCPAVLTVGLDRLCPVLFPDSHTCMSATMVFWSTCIVLVLSHVGCPLTSFTLCKQTCCVTQATNPLLHVTIL